MDMHVTIVIAAVLVVALAVVAAWLYIRQGRSRRLRNQFGPEYERTVKETGDTARAESRLEQLERRVHGFQVHDLSQADRQVFTRSWHALQAHFVDDPRNAVIEADRLIGQIMSARGYPVSDFEQRAADVSVNHPFVVEHYRAGHEITLRYAQGRAGTEDLRQAIIHYRALFAELVDKPELARAQTNT
jgi:hypothetical protein